MADVSLCVSMVARSVMKRRRYWPCHRLRRVCHACSRDRCQQQCLSWKIHRIFTFVSTSFCCIENVGGESLVCYALTFFRFSSSFFRQPLLFVIVHFHFVWITALDQKTAEHLNTQICSYTWPECWRCTTDNCNNRFSITQQPNSRKSWRKNVYSNE